MPAMNKWLDLDTRQALALETLVKRYLAQNAGLEFLDSHDLPLIPGDEPMPDINKESLAGILAQLQAPAAPAPLVRQWPWS
jgi:hypothetical protein